MPSPPDTRAASRPSPQELRQYGRGLAAEGSALPVPDPPSPFPAGSRAASPRVSLKNTPMGASGFGGRGRKEPLAGAQLPPPRPPGNCSLEPLLMRDICYPQAVGSGKASPSNLLLNLRGGSHLLIKSRRSFFSRMDKNVNNNARLPSLQKLPSRRLPREFSLCLSFPV